MMIQSLSMSTFVGVACLLLSAITSSTNNLSFVSAFSTGAGGCNGGVAAVMGTHLTAGTITTGSLTDGSLTLTVDNQQLAEGASITISLDSETLTPITLSGGPEGTFKGFLVRMSAPIPSPFPADGINYGFEWEGNSEVVDQIQEAERCLSQTTDTEQVFGVTHTNPSDKSSIDVSLNVEGFDDQSVGAMDVTVVIQNSGGISTYYHSTYSVTYTAAVVPTGPPVDVPTTAPVAPPPPTDAPSGAAFLSSTLLLFTTVVVGTAVATAFTFMM